MSDTVLYLPPGAKTPVRMPASELAPGCIAMRHVASDGTSFVAYTPVGTSNAEPVNFWPVIPPKVREVCDRIFDRLRPFAPSKDKAEWADGFRHECHPWHELRLWWAMAECYRAAVKRFRASTHVERRRLYNAVVAASVAESDAHAASICQNGPGRHRVVAVCAMLRERVKSDDAVNLAVGAYLDFVPDRSVPIRMTDAQVMAFIQARTTPAE